VIGLDVLRESRILKPMKTVVETETFRKQADKIGSEEERLDFIAFIAANPEAGVVIPGAEGARKIRWSIGGRGKRGGVRVIYFTLDANRICLVTIYQKSDRENMLSNEIKKVR